MKQIRFEWVAESDPDERPEIELAPETIETVIALMARALIAVVRTSEEVADER